MLFNSNDLFLLVHLIFFTLCRFVLLAINADEIIVNNIIIIILINCYQNPGGHSLTWAIRGHAAG